MSMRHKVTGRRRKLHTEEPHNFHSSPNITRLIKSRMMRCVWHTACTGPMRNVYKILSSKTSREDISYEI